MTTKICVPIYLQYQRMYNASPQDYQINKSNNIPVDQKMRSRADMPLKRTQFPQPHTTPATSSPHQTNGFILSLLRLLMTIIYNLTFHLTPEKKHTKKKEFLKKRLARKTIYI